MRASIDGQLVPVPFNLNSLAALMPPYLAEELARSLIDEYGYGRKVPILKLRTAKAKDLRFLADFIYEKVFVNYTFKQWSLRPEELDPQVSARVPIVINRDDRYFQDVYQAIPTDGYASMFERILAHPNIELALGTEYRDVRDRHGGAKVVFTGPIDEFFEYAHGALPYRSLRFALHSYAQAQMQLVGTVNYPNEFDFTRVTELKQLTGQICEGTVLVEEYPEAYEPGRNEPYYPIPTSENALRLKPYLAVAKELEGKVWFACRLGDYAYYNMDQACGRALALFEKQLAPAARSRPKAKRCSPKRSERVQADALRPELDRSEPH